MQSYRQPIIAVLGHVDHGKTMLLDAIRHSAIAEKEAGKITQHIGCSEVPKEHIKLIAKELLDKFNIKIELPGLLFIDTPGHEAFTSLRQRGSSIADIAILVIDINQGIQQQTIESINLLKKFKTPFIVALTKVDKLPYWKSRKGSFISNLKVQSEEAINMLNEKLYGIVAELSNHGFKAERIDLLRDFTKEIAVVPCSAVTKEGIPEILMLLVGLSQKYLKKDLELHAEKPATATILEVKEEKGLGKTIDVVLFDGSLKVNDKFVFASLQGIKESKIKALLRPKKLKETKESIAKFEKVEKVVASAGVKIVARDLDDAIAGTTIKVFRNEKEKETAAKEIMQEIESVQFSSKVEGIIIRADTLGSLEALINMFESNNISIRKAMLGSVTKNDVMEAYAVKSSNPLLSAIVAFNVGIESVASKLAKEKDIKIITGNVIYKILDEYLNFVEEEKKRQREEAIKRLSFPVKIKILEGYVFRKSKPAIVGIEVLQGVLKPSIKLMNEQGKVIGVVKSLQNKGQELKKAERGEKIAISIENAVVGKTIHEGQILYSYIPKKDMQKLLQYVKLDEEQKQLLEEIKIIMLKGGG